MEVLAHAEDVMDNVLTQWCADDTLWPARLNAGTLFG